VVLFIRTGAEGFLWPVRQQSFLAPSQGWLQLDKHYGRNTGSATDLKLTQHIFVADKSDYYEIKDGAEQRAGWET